MAELTDYIASPPDPFSAGVVERVLSDEAFIELVPGPPRRDRRGAGRRRPLRFVKFRQMCRT